MLVAEAGAGSIQGNFATKNNNHEAIVSDFGSAAISLQSSHYSWSSRKLFLILEKNITPISQNMIRELMKGINFILLISQGYPRSLVLRLLKTLWCFFLVCLFCCWFFFTLVSGGIITSV